MSFRFRIDISRCIGCKACEVACVTANDLTPDGARAFVPYLEDDGGMRAHATFAPYLCMHCDDPPCVPACPTGASFKAEDGRVLVDSKLCIGCGMCVPACPYDARYVDTGTGKLEKCTLCEGRVKNGQAPACFDVCPADARLFEEIPDTPDSVPIRVGDVGKPDPGHKVIHLVSDNVNPGPKLEISGRPEDLALLQRKRPPKPGLAAIPGELWRNGLGYVVQGLGVASMAAMMGMVGLRIFRARVIDVAAIKKTRDKQQASNDKGATP